MTDQRRSGLSIADMMIVVVGTALAFVSWRFITSMRIWNGFPDSMQWYYFQALGSVAFLAPCSWTLLVIGWRQSGGGLRQAASEPAGLVGIISGFILLANTALLVTLMALVGWSLSTFADGKVFYYCRLLAEQTGMTIGSIWAIKAMTGDFRKPAGVVNSAAVGIGTCWIILALVSAGFTLM